MFLLSNSILLFIGVFLLTVLCLLVIQVTKAQNVSRYAQALNFSKGDSVMNGTARSMLL